MANKRFILKKLANGAETVLTGNLLVGRSAESGLRLLEGSPSRKHALLSVADDTVYVEDLGSTNGTFVNDKRIDTKVRLKSNDRLRFDVEQFQLRIESDEPTDVTIQRLDEPDMVADNGKARLPPGWLDDAKRGGNKTLYMNPEQLREERKRIAASGAMDAALAKVEAPQLIVLGGPEGTLRIELRGTDPGKKEWSVGSEGEREILIKRVGVSALHAKIVNEGSRWKVIDELSANGTFVNGRRCTMSFLNSADRITFGSVECIFQLPRAEAAAAAAAGRRGNPHRRVFRWTLVILLALALGLFVVRRLF